MDCFHLVVSMAAILLHTYEDSSIRFYSVCQHFAVRFTLERSVLENFVIKTLVVGMSCASQSEKLPSTSYADHNQWILLISSAQDTRCDTQDVIRSTPV